MAIDARIYAAAMAIVTSTFNNEHPNYVVLQNPTPKEGVH
jgi:hypothetical protein